jgi:hypothetical protein
MEAPADEEHRSGILAEEPPCDALMQPAVDSRPQAALDAVAGSKDGEQGVPKSTDWDKLVEPALKRIDCVPVASLALAVGRLLTQKEQRASR